MTTEEIITLMLSNHCTSEHASDMQRGVGEKATSAKCVNALYEYAMDNQPAEFAALPKKEQDKVRRAIKAQARYYFG